MHGFVGSLASKKMLYSLFGNSKLPLTCECAWLCGPATNWRPAQGVPCLVCWDKLQQPPEGPSRLGHWMDGEKQRIILGVHD